MDAVWDDRLDRSRDEAVSWVWGSVHGRGNFGSKCGAPHCNQWGVCGIAVQKCVNRHSCGSGWCMGSTKGGVAACSQITLDNLVIMRSSWALASTRNKFKNIRKTILSLLVQCVLWLRISSIINISRCVILCLSGGRFQ